MGSTHHDITHFPKVAICETGWKRAVVCTARTAPASSNDSLIGRLPFFSLLFLCDDAPYPVPPGFINLEEMIDRCDSRERVNEEGNTVASCNTQLRISLVHFFSNLAFSCLFKLRKRGVVGLADQSRMSDKPTLSRLGNPASRFFDDWLGLGWTCLSHSSWSPAFSPCFSDCLLSIQGILTNQSQPIFLLGADPRIYKGVHCQNLTVIVHCIWRSKEESLLHSVLYD